MQLLMVVRVLLRQLVERDEVVVKHALVLLLNWSGKTIDDGRQNI